MIWRSALAMASGRGRSGRLSILIFHRVLREPDPLFPGEPSANVFDGLVRHLASRFTILSLSEGIRLLREQALPRGALALTFDDGYADNLEVAAPILQRHGVPATVFVANGYLHGSAMFNDLVIEAFRSGRGDLLDLEALELGRHPLTTASERRAGVDHVLARIKYRPFAEREHIAREVLRLANVSPPQGLMLSVDALRRLSSYGLEIGAHTVNHPILKQMEPGAARREIVDSKAELEALLQREVGLFAYPNGRPGSDYGVEHVRMVQDAGFAAAVSTAWGAASATSDLFQLPRFTPWSIRPLKFDLLMLKNLRQGPEQRAA